MTTIPKAKTELKVIQGGKAAPASTDPIVKLRSDETPDRPDKPLTAEQISDLKILHGTEEEK